MKASAKELINNNAEISTTICIIGGNIAGSYLAFLLAKEGIEVLVVEEHKEPGLPVQCTGIISQKLVKLIDFNINNQDVILNRVKTARLVSPDGTILDIDGGKESPLIVDRAKLDKLCYEKALKAGAKFLLSEKFLTYRKIKNGGVLISTDKRKISAKLIVGCDGPHSKIAALNGITHELIFGVQVRSKYDISNSITEMHFNHDWKELFGWIVPEGNGICRIGLGSLKKQGLKLRKFMKKVGVEKKSILETQGGAIPFGYIKRIAFDRTLLLGDSGCMVKATTGGGVVMLLSAAKIAQEVIIQSIKTNNFSESFLRKYYESHPKMLYLKIQLKIHYLIRIILQRFTTENWNLIFHIVQNTKMKDILADKADMDFPLSMILNLLTVREFLGFIAHMAFHNLNIIPEIINLIAGNYMNSNKSTKKI
ncbi:MAG: geranylgeranyl reductase family protein [archaeon]|nr:geranylgeranyl reductase family protein [archaeon]